MRAVEVVTARIANGEYSPGQRLNIGLLADELGVERGTISRAMRVLGERGLVQFYEGLGWHVTDG